MAKVRCRFCKPPNVIYYNGASKFSMSRHRRKYKCKLPRRVPSPPKKYHSNAARKKGARDRKRKSRANKKKVQPVTRPVALQRNVQPNWDSLVSSSSSSLDPKSLNQLRFSNKERTNNNQIKHNTDIIKHLDITSSPDRREKTKASRTRPRTT